MNPCFLWSLLLCIVIDSVFLPVLLKAPPLLSPKSDAVEKRKSLRDEVQVPLPVQKVEPFTTAPGEVEKLRKEVSELREIISKMEKKNSEAIKRLDDKFTREMENLINDFDEERKHNAALKVEIDRLKRRQTRQDSWKSGGWSEVNITNIFTSFLLQR